MRLSNGDLQWIAEECDPPLRLDHYLKLRLPRYSRKELQNFIRSGKVCRVDASGRRVSLKSSSRVRCGDVLQLTRPEPQPLDPASLPKNDLEILLLDPAFIAVNKPAGMLVHPAGVRLEGTLIGELRKRYPDWRLDLAHRLDRETSGLLLVTRGLEMTRAIKTAFQNRRIQKSYLAVVRGQPDWEERICDLPMGDNSGMVRVRQGIRMDGAPALTRFKLLRRLGKGHALLQAFPRTGRLHQIRVHLEALGLPLLGDKIYGGDGSAFLEFRENGLTPELLERLGFWRHALHAHSLTFEHPESGRQMSISAPIPAELQELIDRLDK